MKVRALREVLEELPDDWHIIMSKDAEGNRFSPLFAYQRVQAEIDHWEAEIHETDDAYDDPALSAQHRYEGERCVYCNRNVYDVGLYGPEECGVPHPFEHYTTETPELAALSDEPSDEFEYLAETLEDGADFQDAIVPDLLRRAAELLREVGRTHPERPQES